VRLIFYISFPQLCVANAGSRRSASRNLDENKWPAPSAAKASAANGNCGELAADQRKEQNWGWLNVAVHLQNKIVLQIKMAASDLRRQQPSKIYSFLKRQAASFSNFLPSRCGLEKVIWF